MPDDPQQLVHTAYPGTVSASADESPVAPGADAAVDDGESFVVAPDQDLDWDSSGETDTTVTAAPQIAEPHSGDDESAITPEVGGGEPVSRGGRRRVLSLAVVTGVLLLAVSGGIYLWFQASQQREARSAAELSAITLVQGNLDQLQTASNTADIREVAARAEAARSELSITEDSPPVVASADKTLVALGSLSALSGDTLDQWPTMRAEVEAAAATVATTEVAVETEAALAAVDNVVAKGQETLSLWFLQTLGTRDANTEALGAIERYEAAASAQLSRYNELRREASDWVDRAQLTNTYRASDAERFFTQASSSRRAVRDSLSALTPPAELQVQHEELLSVLTAGVDGIESMLDGLYDNDLCYLDCALSETPGYQQFQTTSAQITQRYGQAVESWQATIAARKAELANASGPPKPEV